MPGDGWLKRKGVVGPWMNLVLSIGENPGYPFVKIVLSNRRRIHKYVHQLVAVAFIGRCPDGMEIRHRDGNKLNCRVDNLVYGTRAQNNADKKIHGTQPMGEQVYCSKLTDEQIDIIFALYRDGLLQSEIAAIFNVRDNTISRIISGVRWAHKQDSQTAYRRRRNKRYVL
jgi:DNA-binding NarL/FixJ family response regulator